MSIKRGNESKPHVGIFGRCNTGKSTLFNMLLGEDNAIVSAHAGTTTDPVRKAFEIPDFAPVMLIDTAGVGDESVLGSRRVSKTYDIFFLIDLVILLYDVEWGSEEIKIVTEAKRQGLGVVAIHNTKGQSVEDIKIEGVDLSLKIDVADGLNRDILCDAIKNTLPAYSYLTPSLFGESIQSGDVVLMVTPIDSEAPAGRLILPQVQTIRDVLDHNAISIVIQPSEVARFLALGIIPRITVVDSQVVDVVSRMLPQSYNITTFSILLAQLKGDMVLYKRGLESVDTLKDGDRVLVLENCLHQTSCEDIGRVKIPNWLRLYSDKDLSFDVVSGLSSLPEDLDKYALAVQCGGCMVTRRQLMGRIQRVAQAGVPITNYGMCIKRITSK